MDRFTLAVVAGVLALIAAALAAAVLVRPTAPPDVSTPGGTVLAYAQAVRRGEPQSAWDLLAPDEQDRLEHDRFAARVGARDSTDDTSYLSIEDERTDADTETASVVLVHTYPQKGLLGLSSSYSTRNTARLVRVDAHWRISVPPDDYSLTFAEKSHP